MTVQVGPRITCTKILTFVLKAYGHELSLASKAAKELFSHSTMITSLFACPVFYCLRFFVLECDKNLTDKQIACELLLAKIP